MRKNYHIKDDFVDARLDRWIRKFICQVPQSLIEKNIRKGNIKINNKKEKCSYKLKKNDLVSLYNINFLLNKSINKKYKYIATQKDISKTSGIFIEDNENFVIINKPADISVQGGTKSRRNVFDILKYTNEFKDSSPYPVHRIDKETTGILIVAKNRKYAQLFTSLFRLRKIHKTYLGVVVGEFDKNKDTLKDELHYYEKNKIIKNKAITHYKVLDANNNYSLLKLNPETGRKHQIRKQLLMHGHPILGDSKYRLNVKNTNKNKKDSLMLHAYKINFSIANKKYNFIAEPNDEFKDILKQKYLKIS